MRLDEAEKKKVVFLQGDDSNPKPRTSENADAAYQRPDLHDIKRFYMIVAVLADCLQFVARSDA